MVSSAMRSPTRNEVFGTLFVAEEKDERKREKENDRLGRRPARTDEALRFYYLGEKIRTNSCAMSTLCRLVVVVVATSIGGTADLKKGGVGWREKNPKYVAFLSFSPWSSLSISCEFYVFRRSRMTRWKSVRV